MNIVTKIKQLIEELCPNGIGYKELQDILTIKNGSDYKNLGEGDFPVYGSGGIMTYVDRFAYDKPSVLIPRKGSIDKLYYVDTPFWNVDTIFYTEINTDVAIPKFVFYCLQKQHLEELNTAGGVPSLTQKVLNKVKIPVPPLPVQSEIVRILDNFTELTAELTAELAARQSQYEYYASNMFPSIKKSDVKWIELGEVATVTKLAGFEFTKYVTYSDTGNIIALRGLNVKNGHLVLDDVKYIDNSNLEMLSRSKLRIGDMLFTYVGTVGQVALIQENDKYYLAPNVALVRITDERFLPEYMMYYFLTDKFKQEQIAKLLQASSMQNIPMEKIRKFKLPLISIEEQRKTIDILNRFDTLCNDISAGLPAEIEARQKQYEYYRDKLLTFKEVGKC